MSTETKSAKTKAIRPKLNKKAVTVALANKGGDNGWTRYDLAAAVGHDVSTVSRAINHGQFPDVIRKIAKELNLPC